MLKKKKQRCERVVTRLEAQLKAGTKNVKDLKEPQPLTDKDIARINRELTLLKTY